MIWRMSEISQFFFLDMLPYIDNSHTRLPYCPDDPDDDGDGLLDGEEDDDNDGVVNAKDADDDNDGYLHS